MKKKLIAVLLCGAMAMGLAACGSTSDSAATDTAATDTATADTTDTAAAATSAEEETGSTVDTSNATYTLRIGMPTAGKHFQNYTAEQFEIALEEATNGDIDVQIYPSSQLGTAAQMIEGVQQGSIESVMIPSSYFSAYAPASAVTDIPFLFEDTQQIYDILNSEDDPLNDYLADYGFTVGAWLKNTPRYILSQTAYDSIDSMKNQKIWCLPATTLQDELTAYGVAPTTMDPSDIAVSLQNGTVDGAETDVIFMNAQGLGESAAYLNEIPATPMINLFCFSTDWLATLPEDYQTLILDTAKSVVDELETAYVDNAYDVNLQGLQDAGVEVVEPSDDLIAALKDASQSVVDTFVATDSDCADIYEQLKAMIDAY